ncbi:hypothetical protein HY285_01685 [Candidatus Peregrinibacteria bacterium]|nr:hypothetical protein [Candidatus Peregrinibacteria bacterium]MBI3816238.1 hypothetical protein [Candidatus Peregrinibacteria bacterium]
MENSLRHRHFVAAPLVLATISLAMLSSLYRSSFVHGIQAFMIGPISAAMGDAALTPGGEVSLLLSRGGSLAFSGDHPVLKEGTLLVRGRGRFALEAGPTVISGFAGAMHVTVHGRSLTVASLTSPALVQIGRERVLVPVHTQWKTDDASSRASIMDGWSAWALSRELLPLPDDFVADQNNAIAALPVPRDELPPMNPAAAFPDVSLLRFPSAQDRSREDLAMEFFSMIRFRIDANDLAGLHELLTDPSHSAMLLHSSHSAWALATLFSRTTGHLTLAQELLPDALATNDASFALLLSVHPDFSASVWPLLAGHASASDTALRLFAFPASDTSVTSLPAILERQWEDETRAFAAAQKEPGSFLTSFASMLLHLIDRFERQGYPERAQRYGSFLLSLTQPVLSSLPPDLQARLQQLGKSDFSSTFLSISAAPSPAKSVPVSSTSSSVPNADELERVVHDLLQGAQAGFTVKTRIQATSPDEVQVRSIVFSGARRDHVVDLTVHPSSRMVDGIIVDGHANPFPLSFQKFVEWVRGDGSWSEH